MISQSLSGTPIVSRRGRQFILRVFAWLLIASIFLGGIQLRRWVGENTRHVRYQHDLVNALYWGNETLKEARRLSPDDATANSWAGFLRGYVSLYDHVKDEAYDNVYHLDYPPLRLLLMAIWAKQVHEQFPGLDAGHPKLVNPLLKINIVCELLSAVAIFFLVRLCVRRASSENQLRPVSNFPITDRASIYALAASTVAWLEPSMILDSHGWPQWDARILPFYLFAALAVLKDRWFAVGSLLAAGSMFKGQLLLVAPFFLLWPVLQKQWISTLRMLAGFAATAAVIVSPWLLPGPAAWIAVTVVIALSSLFIVRYKLPHRVAWFAGIVGCAMFIIGFFVGGSFAWLQIGFIYGSEHYPYLFISSCYNLASLLSDHGWSLKDPLLSLNLGPLHLHLTLQWGLRLIYLGTLALCASGAARHLRNRDPRVLIAIATPWLLMFALLGQMHERYLMWGAVVSAVALGVSIRLTLIHFIISAASTSMIVHVMLIDKKLAATLPAIGLLDGVRPYASILVLGCVAIYLWDALGLPTPAFARGAAKPAPTSALPLGPEPEEA
jgi:hypothetical protein